MIGNLDNKTRDIFLPYVLISLYLYLFYKHSSNRHSNMFHEVIMHFSMYTNYIMLKFQAEKVIQRGMKIPNHQFNPRIKLDYLPKIGFELYILLVYYMISSYTCTFENYQALKSWRLHSLTNSRIIALKINLVRSRSKGTLCTF